MYSPPAPDSDLRAANFAKAVQPPDAMSVLLSTSSKEYYSKYQKSGDFADAIYHKYYRSTTLERTFFSAMNLEKIRQLLQNQISADSNMKYTALVISAIAPDTIIEDAMYWVYRENVPPYSTEKEQPTLGTLDHLTVDRVLPRILRDLHALNEQQKQKPRYHQFAETTPKQSDRDFKELNGWLASLQSYGGSTPP